MSAQILSLGCLKASITYWQAIATDGYGKKTFATPILILGRWDNSTDLRQVKTEEKLDPTIIVTLSQAVAVGDYMALGNYASTTDPLTIDNAYEVTHFDATNSTMGMDTLNRATLKPK